jgi:hypothetical protein
MPLYLSDSGQEDDPPADRSAPWKIGLNDTVIVVLVWVMFLSAAAIHLALLTLGAFSEAPSAAFTGAVAWTRAVLLPLFGIAFAIDRITRPSRH